jgi:hypothetical protein
MIGNGIGVVITSVMPTLGGRQTIWFGGSLSSSRRRKGFTFKFLDFLVNELWVMSRQEKSLSHTLLQNFVTDSLYRREDDKVEVCGN